MPHCHPFMRTKSWTLFRPRLDLSYNSRGWRTPRSPYTSLSRCYLRLTCCLPFKVNSWTHPVTQRAMAQLSTTTTTTQPRLNSTRPWPNFSSPYSKITQTSSTLVKLSRHLVFCLKHERIANVHTDVKIILLGTGS